MSLIKTFVKLQTVHAAELGILLGRHAAHNVKFIYAIGIGANPTVSDTILVNDEPIQVNRYHTRYEGTSRAANV